MVPHTTGRCQWSGLYWYEELESFWGGVEEESNYAHSSVVVRLRGTDSHFPIFSHTQKGKLHCIKNWQCFPLPPN